MPGPEPTPVTDDPGDAPSANESSGGESAGQGGAAEANGASRDDLIKAVEEAMGEEGGDERAPEAQKKPPTAPPKAKTKDEQAEDEDIPALAKALRDRKNQQKHRDEIAEQRAEAQRAMEEAKAAREEAAKLRAEAEAERARILRLRENPIEAIKELGWGTQQLVDEVTREGTPEWRALQALRQENDGYKKQLAEILDWKTKSEEQQKQAEAENQKRQAQAQRAQVVDHFLNRVATEEACPTARQLWDERYLVWRGDQLADEYAAATGQVAPLEEIAKVLEYEARQRMGKKSGQPAGRANGNAPKAKAQGSRTLSANHASERRATPKPVHEMTPDEERAWLMEAAEEALEQST